MNAVSLMYHDVTPLGREEASGFPGGDAARYKLTPKQFGDHLSAIRRQLGTAPAVVDASFACSPGPAAAPWFITFDDGGASAELIADMLEEHGWRGHMFMTTAWIGRSGFLDAPQLRRLRARGHVIGSHSHTHPLRMARCGDARLREEWSRSTELLSDILGEPVLAASVPGGHYSDVVARTAAEAGVRYLFTSEPTTRLHRIDDCVVLGRFVVQRSTTAATAAALAAGDAGARLRQQVTWSARRVCKTVGGPLYLRLREHLLGASPDAIWGDDLPQRLTGPSPSPRIR